MTQYRQKYDIAFDILVRALHGALKTHLVYASNTNFKLIKKYIKMLKEKGLLIIQDRTRKLYITTERGKRYIETYSELKTFL